MKKLLKNPLFTFIIGAIIFSGITGVVAYNLNANNIRFEPSDTTWKKSDGTNITNVNDAINELYKTKTEGVQVATLTTQGATYTMQNDGYIVGTAAGEQSSANIYPAYVVFENDEINEGIFIANNSTSRKASIFVPSGTKVTTRSDRGTYNLTVYEWK